MPSQPVLALELLGTLLPADSPTPLLSPSIPPEPLQLLSDLAASGTGILIHTSLISSDHSVRPVEVQSDTLSRFLQAHSIPFDWIWDRPGKPLAHYFIQTLDDLRKAHREIVSGMRSASPGQGLLPPQTSVQGVQAPRGKSGQGSVPLGLVERKGKAR